MKSSLLDSSRLAYCCHISQIHIRRLSSVSTKFYQDAESDAAKAFLEVADVEDSIMFGIISDEELFKASNVEKDSVVLFKHFDEKRNDLADKMTVESITEFIGAHSMPLVVEFSEEVSSLPAH